MYYIAFGGYSINVNELVIMDVVINMKEVVLASGFLTYCCWLNCGLMKEVPVCLAVENTATYKHFNKSGALCQPGRTENYKFYVECVVYQWA